MPQHAIGRRRIEMIVLQPDATKLPRGPGTLESGVFQIAHAPDGDHALNTRLDHAARLNLPYFHRRAKVGIYRLRGSTWRLMKDHLTVNPHSVRVSVRISRLGTFAVFAP